MSEFKIKNIVPNQKFVKIEDWVPISHPYYFLSDFTQLSPYDDSCTSWVRTPSSVSCSRATSSFLVLFQFLQAGASRSTCFFLLLLLRITRQTRVHTTRWLWPRFSTSTSAALPRRDQISNSYPLILSRSFLLPSLPLVSASGVILLDKS